MRFFVVAPLSIFIVFSVFWLMQWMISSSNELPPRDDNIAMVDFIRALTDSDTQNKQRQAKEPPKPKIPPMMDMPKAQVNTTKPLQINIPSFESSLSSFKGDAFGNMLGGYGFGDSDVIPLVQVEPRYPSQALSRKLEGYVVVRLSITEQGNVESVEVVDAQPKGVFEREAIRAAWRYKFKPKLVDGKPVKQMATLPFEFNLEKK
jgi:protein TonB